MRRRFKKNLICSSKNYEDSHKEYLQNMNLNHIFVENIISPSIILMQKEVKPKNTIEFDAEEYGRGIERRIAEFHRKNAN